MDMIDLALQLKDFDWVKKLLEEKKTQKEAKIEDMAVSLFDKNSIALDNLATQYAIKENNGVRSFNINSNFDRNEADIILVEKPPYFVGDKVKYYVPTKDELTYMRGTVNGYYMGYRDAYNTVNTQYAMLYSALEKPASRKAKSKQKYKGKEKTTSSEEGKESN